MVAGKMKQERIFPDHHPFIIFPPIDFFPADRLR